MGMRIALLTPGTGSFFCGSCLRDDALAAALRRLGHDPISVPLYLPHVTDEENQSAGRPVLFGGINVWLQERSAFFRATPRWVDRLFDAPALLRWAGRRAGATEASALGELTVSSLRGEEGRQKKELDRLADWLAREARPDVVLLSNALLLGMARRIHAVLRVPVACTLQGEDAFLDALPEPHRAQAWAEAAVRAAEIGLFLPVSRTYGETMTRRLGLAPERVRPVRNGIDLTGYAPAGRSPDPPAIGYLARLCPMKGLETLVEAFVRLRTSGRAPRARLHVAGASTAADEAFVAKLRARLAGAGLAAESEFRPNLDRAAKQAFLRGLTVFSVPATYGESFGLYVLEALATGLPVVEPRSGAFPELLEATGGGLLVAPDDPDALADALAQLLDSPAEARELGRGGREAVMRDFGVERMAREVAAALERL